jgi:hypothetical protein
MHVEGKGRMSVTLSINVRRDLPLRHPRAGGGPGELAGCLRMPLDSGLRGNDGRSKQASMKTTI